MDRGQVPTLQNGSSVMDFAFNPFDSNQLLVGMIGGWGFKMDHSYVGAVEFFIGEQSERNAIKGVQIRAGAIYIINIQPFRMEYR